MSSIEWIGQGTTGDLMRARCCDPQSVLLLITMITADVWC